MNATALKAERAARLAEFIELALAKLGVDYTGDAESLKVIKKKSDEQMIANLHRLRRMRDFDAVTPAAPEAVASIPSAPEATGGNGNGARRKATPKVSQAKLDYVASLLRELWASDAETAEELVAELPTFDAAHIDRMIDNIKPILPITDGQARFLRNLIAQKLAPASELTVALLAKVDLLTKIEAKRHLDDLQQLPDYVAPVAAGEKPARRNAPEVEADGMYRNPATGEIFKVQIAHHGSGKLYAKKLVKLDEPTTVRGQEAHYAFEMARGAIMTIKPEWRLTREDAKEFGDLYGCCMRCGTVLTDEKSIERGMGPTCYDKM
jgi:hypothetical protein